MGASFGCRLSFQLGQEYTLTNHGYFLAPFCAKSFNHLFFSAFLQHIIFTTRSEKIKYVYFQDHYRFATTDHRGPLGILSKAVRQHEYSAPRARPRPSIGNQDKMSAQKSPLPTGYLSLPLELRQQILYESFSDAYEKDRKFNEVLIRARLLFHMDERVRSQRHAPSICDWASALDSTHGCVRLDLKFVLKVKLRDFEKDFEMAYPAMIKSCSFNGLNRRWFIMVYGDGLPPTAVWKSRGRIRAALGEERWIRVIRDW